VQDIDEVQDEAEIYFMDTRNGTYGWGGVCPGTGVLCVIKLPGNEPDGDPVYLVSYKGRGRPNIEIK